MSEIPSCLKGIESPDARDARRFELVRDYNMTASLFAERMGKLPFIATLLPFQSFLLGRLWRFCSIQVYFLNSLNKGFAKSLEEEFGPCDCSECTKRRVEREA